MKESTALQILCRNKLENLKLKDFKNSTDFLNEFEKSVNELKEAGANVTEKEKMNYMLRTLPDSMSHIGDLIDVLKEEEQNVEYVNNKIKMAKLKEKSESGKSKSKAFMFEKRKEEKKRTCYVCGGFGHILDSTTNLRKRMPGEIPGIAERHSEESAEATTRSSEKALVNTRQASREE